MADVIGPDVNISRRRRRNPKVEENYEDHVSTYEDEYDDDFVPPKRGRLLKPKPLRNVNSYDSIRLEVDKEKQRKTPVRKQKPLRLARRDEAEEMEDPEMKMSARMVDRIAALNDGKRTKVVMANCFEDRTALDCIDVCLKESENMQEDAVALAIATAVYSLRVDRTHNDAHETRYTFTRGKSDAEKAMLLATGENIENTKEKRRRKKGEKDEEARKAAEAEIDEIHNEDNEQNDWLKLSDSDTFDYTFGMKFPLGGKFLQHWSFTQELLEKVECRRLDVRKNRRKRKLISWKKIPPLEICTSYTDFVHVTANLESDRIDALATFQARRDITGKAIILHDAMVRKPVPPSNYSNEIDLATVQHCKDMLANALQKDPTTWDHFLLEDNPLLYKTGQYLRTGDMTGYVLQERPFYHHFDPEEESADDPRERYSCVERNADKTLYTFKKPPKGTAFGRLAPFIRVPVNKYANPRNRKIEDVYFKEDVEVKPGLDGYSNIDLLKLTADARTQLESQEIAATDLLLVNSHVSPTKAVQESVSDVDEIRESSAASGVSLLDRLKAEHKKHTGVLENLQNELTQAARTRCNSVVKECKKVASNLSNDAHKEDVDEEDIKEWRISRFLALIEPPKEMTFLDTLQNVFSKAFELPHPIDNETDRRKHTVASILGTGCDVVEWHANEETIFNDTIDFVKCGVHSDVRYMDATYHMKVFKFKVTVEQAHESLRQAERIGRGMAPEELAILKQKCFRPGRYNGMCDSGEVSKFYRVDPWCMTGSTLVFSEQYFRCCNYPRMEGRLLQLRNDIHVAAKKIASSSWYYATIKHQDIEEDRRNWLERLNEAVSLYVSYMDKPEEKSLLEKRALPKISRRSLPPKDPTQSSQKANATPRQSLNPHTEETCISQEDTQNSFEEDVYCAGDFEVPGDELCANVGEEVRSNVDKPVEEPMEAPLEQGDAASDTATRKGKNKLDATIEQPPKKKEKKIKTEAEIKVEVEEQEYFVKSEVHSPFSVKDRFPIVDARCTTRGEDITFLRRKPPSRRSLRDYKFENFVKSGLVQKGQYPGVKLEIKRSPSSTELPFNGTLKKSSKTEEPRQKMVTPDDDGGVCEEWLTTYGGFRALPDEGKAALENGNVAEAPVQLEQLSKKRSSIAVSESGSLDPDCFDGSFNDDVYYHDDSDSSKKDRFKDIRPDEFKALGIDVKSLVPKKDFYAMTKEEQAAAVAAEFEAADALGPKKEDGYVISLMGISYREKPYHLNPAKVKKAMKSILSNPLLAYDKVLYTRRALLARQRALERHKINSAGPEVYFKKLDRTLDSSLGPIAEKILEEHNPIDITAIDPIDVLEAVNYRNLDDNGDTNEAAKNPSDAATAGVEESMRQFAAEVRQADFKVQGLHTFSSVMQCLPRRLGKSGKFVNVANALAVTLYMCNENTLTLVQERDDSVDQNMSVNEGEPWMGNFIITNAPDVPKLLGQSIEAQNSSTGIEANDNNVTSNDIFA